MVSEMANFRCKMCGGTLDTIDQQSTAICDYCGTKQTIPKLDNEKRIQMYDRAGHFRRNNEFDKASAIYEQILDEDGTDAEAYWSIVLCRYGVEYVEEPISRKRVPTVNRTQYTSIFDDENYKQAIKNADTTQKILFEQEARTINDIQKGILEISQKEEPFDVFICYKETDENGRRTRDSVLANELYYQLTNEGYKVFFSRITLEEKLGTAYEPYIFAALNSAKVMVVLGTKPEYFNAVWVKNEWSRFLALIKKGEKKILVPAYRDMDPYDLPEEFSHLQAQDMSKLGFMQDLVRGIKKLVNKVPENAGTATPVRDAPMSTAMKRIFIYIEDQHWEEAESYCDKAIKENPQEAFAYLGKLMIDYRCCLREDLSLLDAPFDNNPNYQAILHLGNTAIIAEVKEYNSAIHRRIEQAYEKERIREQEQAERERKDGIYEKARLLMDTGNQRDLTEAIELFNSIANWKDASRLAEKLEKKKIIADRYGEYLADYPIVREKNTIASVKSNLIQMLKETKFGKKGFPTYAVVFLALSLLSLFSFNIFPAMVLGAIFAWIYISKVAIKRAGIVNAILEYEQKSEICSRVPDFYTYAPEMEQYKSICDAFIAEQGSIVSCKEMDEWKRANEAVIIRRETEKQKRLQLAEQEFQGLMANLSNREKEIKENFDRKEQQLSKEKADKTSKFVTLNIFQITEKKEIKERLQSIEAELAALPSRLNEELKSIQGKRTNALNNLHRQKERIERDVIASFPIPPSPENAIAERITNIAVEEVSRKVKEERSSHRMRDKNYRATIKEIIKRYMNMAA